MTTLPNLLRFMREFISYGPLYSLAQARIQKSQPIDPEENWVFWTKSRNPVVMKVLNSYPPVFLRKLLVHSKLKLSHEIGIATHYDVSNEFYKLFLDKKYMFYSCADFQRGDETLEEAQENKANFILNLLDPKPGERILDLGCGWGGMLRHIYEATGDKDSLLGYTLSQEQVVYINENLGFNVDFSNFITTDYQEESFDKIYSIGAWEHVRPSEISVVLQKLYKSLKPGGKLVQHFFCLTDTVMPISMVLGQIFFPGSLLSSYQFQIEAAERVGFRLTHESEHDYRPTLKAWYNNLVANSDKAIELVGVKTYNKYLVFFPVSWRVFDEGQAKVHRMVLSKPP